MELTPLRTFESRARDVLASQGIEDCLKHHSQFPFGDGVRFQVGLKDKRRIYATESFPGCPRCGAEQLNERFFNTVFHLRFGLTEPFLHFRPAPHEQLYFKDEERPRLIL